MIEVNNLVFEYPQARVLHSIDLSIAPASCTALVGPNGAGKTTLLRCLAALEMPFSGSVTIDGVDTMEEPRSVHKNIGYLSDFFGLYNDLTVNQCLRYAALSHGIYHNLDTLVSQTAERLGVLDRLPDQASELSRGLRQRVAIAQAIIHKPPVLLLDEPASGLDPQARMELSALLTELRKQGLTLIVSSHILTELEAYSTHMLMIEDGRIRQHGPLHIKDSPTRTIQLSLLTHAETLDAVVAEIPGCQLSRISESVASIDFEGDDQVLHQILKQLLSNDIPVTEFFLKKASMEQSYLDGLHKS